MAFASISAPTVHVSDDGKQRDPAPADEDEPKSHAIISKMPSSLYLFCVINFLRYESFTKFWGTNLGRKEIPV